MADFIDIIAKLNTPAIVENSFQLAPKKIKNQEIIPMQNDNLGKISAKKISSAPHATIAALKEIEKIIKAKGSWQATDSTSSKNFFKNIKKYQKETAKLEKYISAIAQKGGVDQINQFLKDHGFSSIKLEDPQNPEAVSSASVFDLKVLWETPGYKTMLWLPEKKDSVVAAHLKKTAAFYSAKGHNYPIVELKTSSQERFFLSRFDQELDSSDALAANKAAFKIASQLKKIKGTKYPDGVIFPMASFEDDGRIDSLIGAKILDQKGKEFPIAEAIYAHRFRLDEQGAHAEAANALFALSSAPTTLNIDGPFLAWFEVPTKNKKEHIIPFAVLITEESMKDPGNL